MIFIHFFARRSKLKYRLRSAVFGIERLMFVSFFILCFFQISVASLYCETGMGNASYIPEIGGQKKKICR